MENTSNMLNTRKRSKGVTIFGILVIVFNSCNLLFGLKTGYQNPDLPNIWIEPFGIILNVLSIILTLFAIVLGVNILKLREWARKCLIWLAMVSVGMIFLVPFIVNKEALPVLKQYSESRIDKKKLEETKIKNEDRIKKYSLERQESMRYGAKVIEENPLFLFAIFYFFIGGALVFYELLMIFFFTRPKVKVQFVEGAKLMEKNDLTLQQSSEQASPPQRSKGVTIIGWLQIIQGGLNALKIIFTMFFWLITPFTIGTASEEIQAKMNSLHEHMTGFIWAYIIGFILSVFYIVVGWGLLQLKEKFRMFFIYFVTIEAAYLVMYDFVFQPDAAVSRAVFRFLRVAFYMYFLTRPKVKEQFK